MSGFSMLKAQDKKIPVTTKSEKAKEHYVKGQEGIQKVNWKEFTENNRKAYQEDPDFFLALYNESIFQYYMGNSEKFKEYANKALNVNAKLSKGEKILQKILKELLKDPKADVTEYGEQLVGLYPKDEIAYYVLSGFQRLEKDYAGSTNTLVKALEVTDNPAPIYNTLVYNYMRLGQYDKANEASDKYMELRPDWANVYDTKGDYYMAVEMYGSAYDQFMKALQMDPAFTVSKKKAQKALKLLNNNAGSADKQAKIENTLKSVSFFIDSVPADPKTTWASLERVNLVIDSIGFPDAGYKLWVVKSKESPEFSMMIEGYWPDQETYDLIHKNDKYKNAVEAERAHWEGLKRIKYYRFTKIR